MKYVFNKENIQLKRDEDNGVTMIMIKGTHYQIVLNEVAHTIYNMLDKYKTTEEIIKELMDIYENVDIQEVESDVIEIMSNFELFDVVKLYRIDENTSNEKMNMFGDKYYKKISEYITCEINDNKGIKMHIAGIDKKYYDPMALRFRVMNGSEYGVFYEVEGKIKAVITFSITNPQLSNVINIRAVFINKEVKEKENVVENMIQYILEQSKRVKKYRKVRIMLTKVDKEDYFVDFINRIGFIEECKLENEVESGDLYYYTKII